MGTSKKGGEKREPRQKLEKLGEEALGSTGYELYVL